MTVVGLEGISPSIDSRRFNKGGRVADLRSLIEKVYYKICLVSYQFINRREGEAVLVDGLLCWFADSAVVVSKPELPENLQSLAAIIEL